MMLTGPQEAGVWVLNFLGSAREVLSADEAAKIDSALDVMVAIANGEEVNIDSLFPDLAATQEVA